MSEHGWFPVSGLDDRCTLLGSMRIYVGLYPSNLLPITRPQSWRPDLSTALIEAGFSGIEGVRGRMPR